MGSVLCSGGVQAAEILCTGDLSYLVSESCALFCLSTTFVFQTPGSDTHLLEQSPIGQYRWPCFAGLELPAFQGHTADE